MRRYVTSSWKSVVKQTDIQPTSLFCKRMILNRFRVGLFNIQTHLTDISSTATNNGCLKTADYTRPSQWGDGSLLLTYIVSYIVATGWDYVTVELRPLTGPLSTPQMIQEWIWSSGEMILTEKNRSTGRKTCPSATLSTTNPASTALDSNQGLHCGKPATKRLSYCTAFGSS
jgi:hypothetical protein